MVNTPRAVFTLDAELMGIRYDEGCAYCGFALIFRAGK
jgi:hypothetical protein